MRASPRLGLLALLVASACAHRPSTAPPTLAWDVSARPVGGQIRVVPVLVASERPTLARASFLGTSLTTPRVLARDERVRELSRIPDALGLAVPGAVAAALGEGWSGRLVAGALPSNGRERWEAAITGRADLTATLGALAARVGGDHALFVWVERLHGEPITARGFPGDLIVTEAGPVVVDHHDEPFLVSARVGMALVARDGEVVLRYTDTYDALLVGAMDADGAARALARAIAVEISTLWPHDPRLLALDPPPRW